MDAQGVSRRETRAPLSRERVLRAAIALADAGGIESLTMRRLGQALGVEAMSLYNHVANKDDILDGIVDLVVGEFELPAAEGDWLAAVRRSAVSAHDVLLRHPWACGLMMSPARIRPARLRYMEALLGRLREAGFSARLTHLAYHALDSHILGFTLWQAGYSAGAAAVPDYGPAFLRDLRFDDYPYLAEHMQEHLEPSAPDGTSEFEFSLDLVLDGLERIRASA